jgi:signal transduction histidine kinase
MSDLHPPSTSAEIRTNPDEKASHLAFVTHEIRNPLSTALWSVELLARMTSEERGGARGEKLSRMSMRALTRLRRLVEDHLLAARLDVGGIPIELEEIPAREIFPSAIAIGAGSLELELETGLVVLADPTLARRAIEGILLSAARGGADVRVIGTRRGRVARFRAKGAPVSAAELADPRRGDPGDTRGASLAIPVARRACALLGGSIRVDGEAWVLELPAPEATKRHG